MGGKKHPVSYAENTKRSKKSQALRMTALWGVKSVRLATQKHEKTEKVTGSRDDKGKGAASMESGYRTDLQSLMDGLKAVPFTADFHQPGWAIGP